MLKSWQARLLQVLARVPQVFGIACGRLVVCVAGSILQCAWGLRHHAGCRLLCR